MPRCISIYRIDRTNLDALTALDALCRINDRFAVDDPHRINLTDAHAPGAADAFCAVNFKIRSCGSHAATHPCNRKRSKKSYIKNQTSFFSHRSMAPYEHTETHNRQPVHASESISAFARIIPTAFDGQTLRQSPQPTQR
jgi:hypothetical protein